MAGKNAVAPCGCPGEHVTANYIRCLKGCDSLPRAKTEPEVDSDPGDEDPDIHYCPQCMSEDTEPFTTPFWSLAELHFHCLDCGKTWQVL